jgi:hypothetical protein
MTFFGKKRAGQESVPRRYDGIAGESQSEGSSHRLTLDLSRAMNLATMLASSRASKFIEIPDLLAGLYMYEWDRLSAYWPEENREQVEAMLRDICKISPQRWNYWITLYDEQRKQAEPQPRWKKLGKSKPSSAQTRPPAPSTSLKSAFGAAELISPFRDPGRSNEKEERGKIPIPVVTAECLLLCITKYTISETGKRLVASGLDIEQLERAVIDPKRSPLR